MKYLVVCGGTVSGIGKGITVSSIGVLLKAAGHRVTSIKIDPYLNVDAGTMSPLEHGEVFVLDDGGEVDLDLGNYERFLNVTLTRRHNITSGKVYQMIIEAERKGEFLGKTVQVVPHVTDAIQKWIRTVAEIPVADSEPGGSPIRPGIQGVPEVCLIEVGGTVGDIESAAYFEALRQLQLNAGPGNFALCFVSYVPFLRNVGELKTKPTQHGVKELRALGLFPDILVCRAEEKLSSEVKHKVAMFSNLHDDSVITLEDVSSTYVVPLVLESQGVSRLICEKLQLRWKEPDLAHWAEFSGKFERLAREGAILTIGVVAKYIGISDAYLSVLKALEHASVWANRKLKVEWISAEELEDPANTKALGQLAACDGIYIPGGFGARGFEGKVKAASYARTANKPFLGICFGMQAAVVAQARDVLGLQSANSTELDERTANPVVIFMPEIDKATMGGNMRLGSRTCILADGSLASKVYGGKLAVAERHRHRYEVNPALVPSLEASGLVFSGRSEEGDRMEIVELPAHRFFMGCQFHPELVTKPLCPAPLYLAFLLAASGTLQSA